ncbi:SCO family protein [Szabonella alba]|uniref:SCO family protein n=1 Tax=Szabonella alba TaxID=2804194 RepID=A0A8K0V7L2_9RHOB|nr:SCO family protein [Szabonella alba]MBL4916616.1 SCO family protein [Szabonella alba]
MVKLYAGLAAAATAALLGGTFGYIYLMRSDDPYAACRNGQVAGGSIGGPFTLTDQTGASVTEAEVLAQPALVYFGYTFCPDVCPLDNARNAEAADILEEMGHQVNPVFITVDPGRDTVEVMAEYAEVFHPRMQALTGSEEQVKAAAQAYKVYSQAHDKTDDYYLVDHSTFTYLMLPGTGFAEFFKREESADRIAERVSCFLDG